MPPAFFRRLAAFMLLPVLLFPAAGSAQVVHKCRTGDGSATYQDRPCAAGAQQAWARPMPASTVPVVAEATRPTRPVAAPRPAPARNSGSTRKRRQAASGAVISQYRDPQGCEKAKAQRAQVYARLGLRRDFDTSRHLDDRVNAACR